MKDNNKTTDDLNPDFLFNGIATELLVKSLNGELDLFDLAKTELKKRGLNNKGEWE